MDEDRSDANACPLIDGPITKNEFEDKIETRRIPDVHKKRKKKEKPKWGHHNIYVFFSAKSL